MFIPESIGFLLQRLALELDKTEQTANRVLNLRQSIISIVAENAIMIRYYAYLNNVLFLVNISREKIEIIRESFLSENVTDEQIQEAGEDLSLMLG